MKNTKPKGYGAYTPKRVKNEVNAGAWVEVDGLWYPAKPEPYYSVIERLKYAWDVLTYRADPLYWYFEKGFKRTPQGGVIDEND